MNRLAIVLAADSATTVTHVTEDGEEERYFKGANKIFQLSNHKPVGIMIFDSADILNVPWELVIKCFRRDLEDKSFNDLRGYAEEFFRYLSTNLDLFPETVQAKLFTSSARRVALRTLITPDDMDEPDKQPEVDKQIESLREELAAATYPKEITPEFQTATIAKFSADLRTQVEQFRPHLKEMPADLDELVDLAIRSVLAKPDDHFGNTGLVFAGYGDHAVFPEFLEFASSGIVVGTHVATEVSKMAIDHERPAWIRAFAQTAMSDTFTLGLARDVFASVMAAVKQGMSDVVDEVAAALGSDRSKIPDPEKLVTAAAKKVSTRVLDEARDEHATPLRRVLGVLPVDEMAELAETLINLQSLKEKVTRPSETVGGPVDVAVITRNEGLVWIKRKHYFDPALNSRFLQRQALAHKA